MTSYYSILGVSKHATTEEIQVAWKRVAKELHPDRNPHPDAQKRFMEAKKASVVLLDPTEREKYDDSLLHPSLAAFASGKSATARSRPMAAPSSVTKKALRDLEQREKESSLKRQRTVHHPQVPETVELNPPIIVEDEPTDRPASFSSFHRKKMDFFEYERFVLQKIDSFQIIHS